MCNAFSFIVSKAGKVIWKCGSDSHEELIEHFKLKDDKTDSDFVRCEIAPKNKIGYLHPDCIEKGGEWIFKFDNKEGNAPDWWKKKHDLASYSALDDWKKEVYSKIDLEQVCNPINPFKIKAPKITEAHKKLLKKWVSVRGSVWNSVWDSVKGSVGGSVGDSVWDSVWDSVGDSVGDSVKAYIGSMFKLKRSEWKHTEKIRCKGYPFQPAVTLWKQGLVAAFDGKSWSLYGSKKGDRKCEKLYEMEPDKK